MTKGGGKGGVLTNMNEKLKLEKIVRDTQNIQVPKNRFYHRHFLLHEAGKISLMKDNNNE